MTTKPTQPPYFINCHTHIFVGANIPPYIAKTFLPWPFYKLLSIPLVLTLCKFWYVSDKSPRQWKHKWWYKKIQSIFYLYRSFIGRYLFANLFVLLINIIIVYHAVLYVLIWVNSFFIKPNQNIANNITYAVNWLIKNNLFFSSAPAWLRLVVFFFTLLFIASGRKLIWFALKKVWAFMSVLPDKKTLQFLERYINIGRFAYYKNQGKIFLKLKDQYPEQTGFVILPMDMEFMEAGSISTEGDFKMQMEQLAAIKANKNYKNLVFPFVAIDPRRKIVGQQVFFDWEPGPNGTVILKDCFIKDYIEDKKFHGFKIYPALGYYPFEEVLLPLWKYALDNNIPILTHCIRGTIFYRGIKKKEWGWHPVFKQSDGLKNYSPLLLPELKNIDFINNFTHPLNYLCLVEEKLLRLIVSKAKDVRIKELFEYTDDVTPMTYNLKQLKLCFGHFGGEDEWQKYFEKDRDNFTNKLVTQPGQGINFIKPADINNSFGTLELVWKSVDWYSIISSMILQYDNLYADISYIVHDESIIPLLKQTLSNSRLKEKVLFGTDFYVVRNHKSEKQMLANLQAALTPTELYFIGRKNPKVFLNIP